MRAPVEILKLGAIDLAALAGLPLLEDAGDCAHAAAAGLLAYGA